MNEIKTETKTYCDSYGWRFDIVINYDENEMSAWLYHKNYGVKDLMWSEEYVKEKEDEFFDTVVANLSDYKYVYFHSYMTDGDCYRVKEEYIDRWYGNNTDIDYINNCQEYGVPVDDYNHMYSEFGTDVDEMLELI